MRLIGRIIWVSIAFLVAGAAGIGLAFVIGLEHVTRIVFDGTNVNSDPMDVLPKTYFVVSQLGLFTADDVHGLFAGAAIMGRVSAQLQAGLSGLWHTGTSVAGGMVNVIMIPVFAFFMMIDFPKFARTMERLTPADLRGPAPGQATNPS